jgi:DNA-binding MarR family transcriptional regulator
MVGSHQGEDVQEKLYRVLYTSGNLASVNNTRTPSSSEVAARLRTSVGALVRATRTTDRLAPIPAAVLDLLDLRGPMTTAELAAGRGVRHQTMAATVKELGDAGYVVAAADPHDGRKKVLALTKRGAGLLEADREQRVSVLSGAVQRTLSRDERRALADALALVDRVTADIEQADQGSPAPRGPVTGAW